jgi:cytoskeletal protein RodZ
VFEIGNSLREARLRRQMEFAEAEYGTKIRGKYLRALEDERFELLPSHTYVKGFLRSYAEYLGLDGQLYVDEYNSRYVTGEDDAPMRATRRVPAAKARRTERRESNIVLLALTAIGLVTALVIVAWRFGGVEDEQVRGLTTPQRQQQATPAPQAAGTARLELRATRGDSYMIVRSGSAIGEGNVLYKGTLEHGQKQRFDSRVLWLRLEMPQNVLVKLNGNRVTLPKKAVKAQGVFVTAKKVFAADAR